VKTVSFLVEATYILFFLVLVKLSSNVGHKTPNLCLDCQVAVTGWKQKSSQCLARISFAFDFLAFSDMRKVGLTQFVEIGKMKRLCFSGGVTVVLLVDKVL